MGRLRPQVVSRRLPGAGGFSGNRLKILEHEDIKTKRPKLRGVKHAGNPSVSRGAGWLKSILGESSRFGVLVVKSLKDSPERRKNPKYHEDTVRVRDYACGAMIPTV